MTLAGLITILGIGILIYVVAKGFSISYKPPTLAVNAGNPAFTVQV